MLNQLPAFGNLKLVTPSTSSPLVCPIARRGLLSARAGDTTSARAAGRGWARQGWGVLEGVRMTLENALLKSPSKEGLGERGSSPLALNLRPPLMVAMCDACPPSRYLSGYWPVLSQTRRLLREMTTAPDFDDFENR